MKKTFISEYINRMLPSIILSQIITTICTTIDAALTGQFLGDDALAAEGMVTPVVMVVVAVAGIMSAGNATICSNASGKGDIDEVNRVFSTTFTVSLSVSVICTALILIFSDPICQFLGLTPGSELYPLTEEYLSGYVPLMPMFAVIMTIPPLLQIEGDNKTTVIAAILVLVLDIVFDLLNIFVYEGGVFGMALATTFSYYVSGTLMIVRFFMRKRTIKFSLRYVELNRVGKILSYGTPAFFADLSTGLITGTINAAFLKYASELHVAAFAIVMKVGDLLLCFCSGMGEMTAMVTGIANGDGDKKELKEILRIMFKKSVTINLVLIVITWLLAPPIMEIFTDDETVMSLGAFGLRVFSLQFIFYSMFLCYVGYFRGLKRYMLGNIALSALAGVSALFALYAPLQFGENVIWYSQIVAVTVTLSLIILFVGIFTKKNPFSWDNLILKPDSYGVQKENFFEWEISDIETLCKSCATAAEFVENHGGSKRQIFLLPLFMEEMGKNILTWAFRDGKEHRLTIKIMRNAEGFILRFRDNGVHFDPAEYYKIHKGENPVENFGIRMVFSMASEVTYLNTMNLNNLIVKL